jgi:hydrogenase maturation factor HypF (carbamoyltransferase family)
MSAVIKGTGIVWSVGGITYAAAIAGAKYVQSVRVGRTSEKAEVKDNGGTIKAVVFHGFKKTLALTVVPAHATTQSGAQTSMDQHQLQAGTLVAIADDIGTIIDANYNVISTTQNRTVDGVATIDLELEASDEGVDITTVVA